MSKKRFTDANKWSDDWFMCLKPIQKLVWIYINDNCDHAGIWRPNFKLLEFQIGSKFTKQEFIESFSDKLIHCRGVFVIPSFLKMQFKNKNNNSNATKSAKERLSELFNNNQAFENILDEQNELLLNCSPTVHELLPNSCPTVKEEEKEIDKDKDLNKEKEKEIKHTHKISEEDLISGNYVLSKKDLEEGLERIYNLYPRKEGKTLGLKKLAPQLKKGIDIINVVWAVRKYVEHIEENKIEPKYIKHFSTFVSCWKDWDLPSKEVL